MKKALKTISVFICICIMLSSLSSVSFAASKDSCVLFDTNKKSTITEASSQLTADGKIKNNTKYSAKWVVKDATTLTIKAPSDFTPYNELKFSVYSEKACSVFMWLKSENGTTQGVDYYGDLIEIKAGWNDISIELANLPVTRTPLGYNKIGKLEFLATGWNMTNDIDNMVLYFESMTLCNNENYASLADDGKSLSDGYDDTKEPGTQIMYNRTYDESGMDVFSGLLKFPKSNILSVYTDENKNNSLHLAYPKNASEDGYFEVTLASDKTFLVTELSLSTTTSEPAGIKLEFKDEDRKGASFFSISGKKIICGEKEIGTVKKDEWTKIAICANFAKNTCSIYINGELKAENYKFAGSGFKNIILMRVYGGSANAGKDILVDNFRIYEGKQVRELNGAQPSSENSSSESDGETSYVRGTALESVKDAVCLRLNTPNGLVNGIKTPIDKDNTSVSPFVINGRTLVPVRFISESFGANVTWQEDTKTVTVSKDQKIIKMQINSDVMNVNGTDVKLDVPAAIYNDRTMLPLRAVTESLGKQVYWHDLGLIIISDKENILEESSPYTPILELFAEMTYERPSGEEIYADLKNTNPSHPRLLADKTDFDRIRSLYGSDQVLTGWIDQMIASADKSTEYIALPTHVIDSGGRWTPPSLNAAAMGISWQITGNKKYINAVWQKLEVLCAFEDWHPGHYLNCADCMREVAIIYDWMYDGFTPHQRKTIEEAMLDKAINSGIGAYEGASDHITSQHGTFGRSGWTQTTNNWNAVCNSGLTMAAIAVFDVYPAECSKLMEQVMRSVELGVECYAPDGSYEEGPTYWAYGTGNLANMLMSLDKAMGTTYGIFNAPGLANTCYFPCFTESSIGSWNFHDSPVQQMDTSILTWFGQKLGDYDLATLRYNEVSSGAKALSYRDIIHYDPSKRSENVNLPLDKKFDGIQTVFMRSGWADETALFTGLHGGCNNVNHGNIDAGNFILDAGGERFICDLGQDNYNMNGYFGKGEYGSSYKYYRKSGEGQNTICILGDSKIKYGQNALADIQIEKFESKAKGSYAILNMQPAYGNTVTSGKRGIMLTGNRDEVVVQDEIKFAVKGELYWFAHSENSEIEISPDGKNAVITKNGQKMGVTLLCSDSSIKLDVMDAKAILPATAKAPSGEYSRENFKKLFIHAKDVSEFKAAVVFKALSGDEKTANISYEMTDMNNWNIPDGQILDVPVLDNIYIDSEPIEAFNAKKTSYTVVLPYDADNCSIKPVTAASSDGCNIEIKQSESLTDASYIIVSRKDNPAISRTYTINYQVLPEGLDSGRWDRIMPISSKASDTPEAEHTAGLVSDGNSADESRWSANGDGQWVEVDLGEEKEFKAVGLSVWKGSTRHYQFDVQVSSDGVNYTTVLKSRFSSGLINDIEIFKLDSPVKARYVRYVGYGNNENKWNSVTEFAVLKLK